MIWLGDKKVSELRFGAKAVTALYLGALLIWSAISSCFGSGLWLRDQTWSNDETWINN